MEFGPLATIALVAWWALGYTASRRLAAGWFADFGNYDGMPTAFLFVIALVYGPLGWVVALLCYPPRTFNNGVGAKVFGGKR